MHTLNQSPIVVERWQVLSTWNKLSFPLPEPCRSSKGNWAWLAGRRGRGNGCWGSEVSNDPSSLLQFPCQVVFQTQFNVSQASSTTPHSSFCQGELSWIWDLSGWHVSLGIQPLVLSLSSESTKTVWSSCSRQPFRDRAGNQSHPVSPLLKVKLPSSPSFYTGLNCVTWACLLTFLGLISLTDQGWGQLELLRLMGSRGMGICKVPEEIFYTYKALVLLEVFFPPMEI